MLLTSCTNLSPETENLSRVANKAARKIEIETGLTCQGIGSSIPEKITDCDIIFHHRNSLTIEEARNLILNSINISLRVFQNDIPIQDYLSNKPFNINNMGIYIFTANFFSKETPENLISQVTIYKSSIFYKRYEISTKKFVTVYEETYEEALQKCEAAF